MMDPRLVIAATEAVGGHGDPSLLALGFGVLLLIANGFFVAAEIALLAANRARVEELADAGDRRAVRALAMLRQLSITFTAAQLGITMASLALGAVAEPAVVGFLERALGGTSLPDAVSGPVAFGLGLAVVVFLHMVVGEMAPKNLALARPERVAMVLSGPFRWFVLLVRPVLLVVNGIANWLVRLLGVQPVDERSLVHTPGELLLALREADRRGNFEPAEARVLSAALSLEGIDAEAAMTPRVDLVMLPDSVTPQAVLDAARESGHTRFPVFHGDVDNVIGLVHVKDVLTREPEELAGVTVADLLRPIPAVPEGRDLEHLLLDMRSDRSHAVLVVDEFGGTAGMLTLEDLLEELVGEIVDEFDVDEVAPRRPTMRSWVVDGTIRKDELARLAGLELPEGQTETLSGHLTEVLGRLVRLGDRVDHDGWVLLVRSVEGHRAGRVEIVAPEEPAPSADEET